MLNSLPNSISDWTNSDDGVSKFSLVVFGGAAFLGSLLWCIPYKWSSLPHTFLIQQTTLLAAALAACMTLITSPYGYMLTSSMLGLVVGGLDVFIARQLSRLFIQEEAVSVDAWSSFFRGVGSLFGIPLVGMFTDLLFNPFSTLHVAVTWYKQSIILKHMYLQELAHN